MPLRRPHHAVDRRLPVVEDRLLADVRPRIRGVDHHAVADVEADVADVVVEEDQVTGSGVGEGDGGAGGGLVVGRAGDIDAAWPSRRPGRGRNSRRSRGRWRPTRTVCRSARGRRRGPWWPSRRRSSPRPGRRSRRWRRRTSRRRWRSPPGFPGFPGRLGLPGSPGAPRSSAVPPAAARVPLPCGRPPPARAVRARRSGLLMRR